MPAFDDALTAQLAVANEIRIETRTATGVVHQTPIWVVVVDGGVYVRSVNGIRARWYREAIAGCDLAVHLANERIAAVASRETDAAMIAKVSDAYLEKHAAADYEPAMSMVRDETLPATLRLQPA